MQRVRLLLVDDHPLFREGLMRLLASEPDLEMVAQCGTATEGLEVLTHSEVDVVLLDSDLEVEHGNQFISSARECGYAGKILMVTAGMNATQSSLALKLGASGIVLKSSSTNTLLTAIKRIVTGELWIDQNVIHQMVDQVIRGDQRILTPNLTHREDQVLQALLEGLTNKEIATKIGVSEDSVKTTLKYLFRKTGVRTRSQLVRMALEGSLHTDKEPRWR